ncbi:hypothetical protein AOL_s00112g38 [Orbilia oligospora ATCC 24927]|uniref:Uncharacterized protein n=1 Tax=Arthrobotrys oligospora (strain ATCC 24927 / CBS 115.81 / DSM 1491) TaxID=756982 RepID=G1XLK8_ARTOA|nr:hypothetical protein AOL_s00112g38 [Orbilia oligospora ATCC 24927]EGX45960.1 hypothetical protein AOL_s00112g38 [Orbilia oligospora ATCC 24927]
MPVDNIDIEDDVEVEAEVEVVERKFTSDVTVGDKSNARANQTPANANVLRPRVAVSTSIPLDNADNKQRLDNSTGGRYPVA